MTAMTCTTVTTLALVAEAVAFAAIAGCAIIIATMRYLDSDTARRRRRVLRKGTR